MNASGWFKLGGWFSKGAGTRVENAATGIDFFPNLNRLEREARVTEIIQPGRRGRVYFQGTWWNARCEQLITLNPDESVFVVARLGLTLLVEPGGFNYLQQTVVSQQVA
jgi:membrane-bound ClpP family serine protease